MDTRAQAIASPVRRAMRRRLWDGERAASDIAARVSLRRPAASLQSKVLRDAGLLAVRVEGTRRLYAARIETLDELRGFLEAFWGGRLAAMRDVAESRSTGRRGEAE